MTLTGGKGGTMKTWMLEAKPEIYLESSSEAT